MECHSPSSGQQRRPSRQTSSASRLCPRARWLAAISANSLRTIDRVLVAGVVDGDVHEADRPAQGADGGQDLLVNAVLPADFLVVAKQPDVVHRGGDAADRVGQAQALHAVGGVFVAQRGQQGPQLLAVDVVDAVVGVQPQDPVAGGVPQRLVARRREVVAPGEVHELHLDAEGGGNLPGAVGRAGVHHDDLVDEVDGRAQAVAQVGFLILDNRGQALAAAAAAGEQHRHVQRRPPRDQLRHHAGRQPRRPGQAVAGGAGNTPLGLE